MIWIRYTRDRIWIRVQEDIHSSQKSRNFMRLRDLGLEASPGAGMSVIFVALSITKM
jgi:hypothetical protein